MTMDSISRFLDRQLLDGCCNKVPALRNVWRDKSKMSDEKLSQSLTKPLETGGESSGAAPLAGEERLERELRAAGFEKLKPGTREAEQWAAYTGAELPHEIPDPRCRFCGFITTAEMCPDCEMPTGCDACDAATGGVCSAHYVMLGMDDRDTVLW